MKATIYSKENCPFCTRAKALLTKNDISFKEVHAVENKEELVARVEAITGQPPKTVPQIWLGDEYIGGYQELAAHLKTRNASK